MKALSVLLTAACTLVTAAHSQGWIESAGRRSAVTKIRSAVEVQVTGRTARVTVDEWFRNDGGVLAEGTYHYPLSRHAVFHDFSLWQGNAKLHGETLDAARAREIYEEIVRRKRDPALIEMIGHRLVRARVFPIDAGETRRIALRYDALLQRQGDAFRFRWLAGPPAERAPVRFTFRATDAERFAEPYSPTHRLSSRRDGNMLEVTVVDSNVTGTVDIFLPLAEPAVGLTLLSHTSAGEDPYFMLLLAPGTRHLPRMGKNVTAVVDVSGSMAGAKLEQAQRALEQLLASLHPGDHFRLVAFSGAVRRFSGGWTASTGSERRRASEWIRGLEAHGGTNVGAALAEAFAQPVSDRLHVVVLLTDGRPTVGTTDPEAIAEHADRARGNARVFAIGLGDDVNTYVLERLVERGRGAVSFLPPQGNLETAVSQVATQISHPVLTEPSLSGEGVELYDVEPAPLPDLFAGDELVIVGRLRAVRERWRLEVTGQQAGSHRRFAVDGEALGPAGNDFVPKLWAARRVARLSRHIRLHGTDPEIVDEIRRLGLRFGILTEYTSYLVQEPETIVATTRDAEARPVAPSVAAPADQVGRVARERAARSGALGAASKAVELDDANEEALGQIAARPTRRVGSRIFVRHDQIWRDIGVRSDVRTVSIKPYSQAYFALVRALPEIAPYLILGERIQLAGRAAIVEIAPDGSERIARRTLEKLVEDYRPKGRDG